MFGPVTSASCLCDEAHGHMGWGGASYQCYPKVMSRSSQGHNNDKSAKKGKKVSFGSNCARFGCL